MVRVSLLASAIMCTLSAVAMLPPSATASPVRWWLDRSSWQWEMIRRPNHPCAYRVPDGATVVSNDDGSHSVWSASPGSSSLARELARYPPCTVLEDAAKRRPHVAPDTPAPRHNDSRRAASPTRSVDPFPLPNAWSAYAEYVSAYFPVTAMSGEWTVPPAPQAYGLVALFIALQNLHDEPHPSKNGIIQPVLQWGEWASGGDQSWGLASWEVKADGSVMFSSVLPTQPGHTIRGTMELVSTHPVDEWLIVTTDVTAGQSVQLKSQQKYSELWTFVSLEVYDLASCHALPQGTVTFSALNITAEGTYYPTWDCQTPSLQCNLGITSSGPAAVTIAF